MEDLRTKSVVFGRLIDEYGKREQAEQLAAPENNGNHEKADEAGVNGDAKEKKAQAALMQQEERARGAVSVATYLKWFRLSGSVLWAPVIISLLLIAQGAAGAFPVWALLYVGLVLMGYCSGEQPTSWILDSRQHRGLVASGLHGRVRWAWRRTSCILVRC